MSTPDPTTSAGAVQQPPAFEQRTIESFFEEFKITDGTWNNSLPGAYSHRKRRFVLKARSAELYCISALANIRGAERNSHQWQQPMPRTMSNRVSLPPSSR
jgi:hypothetical protein